jgi:UDP-N-acetylmuramyl pentapeptide phosphotransferase/UDP-N-acetylglucosamine-1-phosphate transferase
MLVDKSIIFLIHFLYQHKLWKKYARVKAISGEDAVVFNNLHKERETSVPRMGGLLILLTILGVAFFFMLLLCYFLIALLHHLIFYQEVRHGCHFLF